MGNRTCSVPHCPDTTVARGWCDKHYRRWRKTGDPAATSRVIGDDRARFFSHVNHDAAGGCWLWSGSHNAPRRGSPYGTFRYQEQTRPAHVVAYLLARGPDSIPAGMVLDHLCSTPLCVNPAHLEPVTQRENVHRGRRTKVPPERITELARERDAGASVADLARAEGVTPQALRLRFNQLAA